MNQVVRLNRIDTVLSTLEYPVSSATVVSECDGIVVELAEGAVELDEVMQASHGEQFKSAEDLKLEFLSLLPRHAVGEPYQSDGDA